ANVFTCTINIHSLFYSSMLSLAPRCTRFPYTTLFRSHQCQTLEGAFATIQQVTKSSLSQVQAVLLSPACASFDQFSGFAERGKRSEEHTSELQSRFELV